MFANLRMDPVFIACESTDLPKSVDGPASILQESFQLDPSKYLTYVLEQLPLIDLTEEAALDVLMSGRMKFRPTTTYLNELQR